MSGNGKVSPSEHARTRQNSTTQENVELDLFGVDDDVSQKDNSIEQVLLTDLPSNHLVRSLHSKSLKRPASRQKSASGERTIGRTEVVDGEPGLTSSGHLKRIDATEILDLEQDANPAQEVRENEIIKSIPAPMAHRRSLKRQQMTRRKSNIAMKQLSCWKAFKLRTAMSWTLFKTNTRDWFVTLELWRGPLKEIEGNFGNGVLSYFLFLKSLLFLNITIFLCMFCFIVVPQIVADFGHLKKIDNATNVGQCQSVIEERMRSALTSKSPADEVLDFFTGQGYINTTLMFYSTYHGSILVDINNYSTKYDMPLAYMLVGGAYFIISLMILVKNLAKGFTESIVESGGMFYSYCNKVFASWDYCITSERAVVLKNKNIFKDFEAELAEAQRLEELKRRTRLDKCRIYTIRLFMSIFVMGLLTAAVVAIVYAVGASTDKDKINGPNEALNILTRWAPSLTISALNVALPPLFELLSKVEQWSPRMEVAMVLWRSVILKLASIAVLVITLYKKYDDHKCQECWENQIGSQMFNLIIIDFFVSALLTIVVETSRKYAAKYMKCGCDLGGKIGPPEFQIPKNVLDLVYGQSLIWIGTFFAPLIPVMGILKLIIMFYVKKVSLIHNCKPSSDPYRGARSNYFFTLLLLLTFLLCSVAVGWGITRIPTSCCGPFSNYDCAQNHYMINIIKTTVDGFPDEVQQVLNFLKEAVFLFPLFIILFLVLYYYHAMTKAHDQMITMLKEQLVMEGKDKRFLIERLIRATEEKERVSKSRKLTEVIPAVGS